MTFRALVHPWVRCTGVRLSTHRPTNHQILCYAEQQFTTNACYAVLAWPR
jgi:hypothetical protein